MKRENWPDEVEVIEYRSAVDGAPERAMFYAPRGSEKVPLLVRLHAWSHDYAEPSGGEYARLAIERGWAAIHPDFRGPNNRPEAMGSELAVAGVIGAVEYARRNAAIDASRVYLVGTSGGGYAALLLAGRAPELWAAVSAWVPIFDLIEWHGECLAAGRPYARMIERAAGGDPRHDAAARAQCVRRSAAAWLANAGAVPLDINTGIRDGHDGSVPVSHAIRAFNLLAAEADRIGEEEIGFFVARAAVPPGLGGRFDDPAYGEKRVLFRRTSRNVRLTIFDGGHEGLARPAVEWLADKSKGRA